MTLLPDLMRMMLDAGASDLHLSSNERPQIRKDGDLLVLEGGEKLEPAHVEAMLEALAPPEKWKEFEKDWDTDFACDVPDLARYRASYFMDRFGPGAVFRAIPPTVPTAEQVGLPRAVMDLCFLTKGLVVITGPSGCGKTSTMASMIDYINDQRKDHVITVEDPIEYRFSTKSCLINQREVHRHTESFKRALRAALREDPDIVMIGEMRDLETVEIALETAETGHLVFGTMTTATAISTVDRIIDQFPPGRQSQIRTMMSSSLKGIISQALCKKKTGGRVAAMEILLSSPAVSTSIREAKTYQISSAMQVGGKAGMRIMSDALLELVKQKVIDPEEAYIRSGASEELIERLIPFGFKSPIEAPAASSS